MGGAAHSNMVSSSEVAAENMGNVSGYPATAAPAEVPAEVLAGEPAVMIEVQIAALDGHVYNLQCEDTSSVLDLKKTVITHMESEPNQDLTPNTISLLAGDRALLNTEVLRDVLPSPAVLTLVRRTPLRQSASSIVGAWTESLRILNERMQAPKKKF